MRHLAPGALSAMWRIIFQFADGDGNEGQTGLWFGDISPLQVDTAVAAYASALATISSAKLTGAIAQRRYPYSAAPDASPSSDVYTRAVLLFREGLNNYGSFTIPSPLLPAEMAGPYRDIRYTRQALALSGVLASVELIASRIVKPGGGVFPTTYSVGGRDRNML